MSSQWFTMWTFTPCSTGCPEQLWMGSFCVVYVEFHTQMFPVKSRTDPESRVSSVGPTQAAKHLHWINYVVCVLRKHCTVGFSANEAILCIVFQTWQTLVENMFWSSETSSQQNWFDTKLWSHTSGTPNFSPFSYLHTHLIYHARA